MDGVETLKEIMEDENTNRIPVVMVSSTKGTDREDKCRELGCADFLMKPIKVSQLNDSLQEIMEKTGANRRKHLRTKFKKKVTIIHRGKPETHDAETLSEGGIYVKKSPPLPVGTELEVIMPYRQEQTIQAKGSVIYIKESEDIPLPLPIGMAIQFTGMSEEISRLLSEYVMEIITGKQKL
jgi:CheY-like chemotaxis protein